MSEEDSESGEHLPEYPEGKERQYQLYQYGYRVGNAGGNALNLKASGSTLIRTVYNGADQRKHKITITFSDMPEIVRGLEDGMANYKREVPAVLRVMGNIFGKRK